MSQAAQTLDATLTPQKAAELYRLWCQKNAKACVEPDLSKTERTVYKGREGLVLRAARGYKLAIVGLGRKGLGVLWGNSFSPLPQVSRRSSRLLDDEWVLTVN